MGALILSVEQTVLIFVGVPLLVIALVAGLIFAGGGKARAKRYRPGRPYDYAPVWFTAAPAPTGVQESVNRELAATTQAALPATTASAPGVTGGASDRW
ncbi:MAG: hypothetical protein HOV79_13320 [Hamadaea sp.]|nr:hypothetical protein [Hamadaea sp.]